MQKSAKDVLKSFTEILKESAKFFGVPQHSVTGAKFILVANGRLGAHTLQKYGGFTTLRAYVAPSPSATVSNETRAILEKIFKNAKAA